MDGWVGEREERRKGVVCSVCEVVVAVVVDVWCEYKVACLCVSPSAAATAAVLPMTVGLRVTGWLRAECRRSERQGRATVRSAAVRSAAVAKSQQ